MIDDRQRPRYWMYTTLLAGGVVALIVLCVLVLPLIVVALNADSVLGFPLGYYLAAQGVMIAMIVAVYWAGSRQAETDRKFGAIDDS